MPDRSTFSKLNFGEINKNCMYFSFFENGMAHLHSLPLKHAPDPWGIRYFVEDTLASWPEDWGPRCVQGSRRNVASFVLKLTR